MKSHLWGSLLLLGVVFLPGQTRASNLTINFDNLGENAVISGMVTPCTAFSGSVCTTPGPGPVVTVSNQYQASDGVVFSACLTSAEIGGACPTFANGNPYVVVVESNTSYASNPPTTHGQTLPNIIALATVASDPSTATSATLVTNSAGTSPGISLILTFTNAASNLTFDAYGNDTTTPPNAFAHANITFNNGTSTASNVALDASTGATLNGQFPDSQSLSAFPNITRLEIFNDTDANGTAFDNFGFTTADASAPEPSPLVLMGFGGLLLVMRRVIAYKR